MATRGRSLYWKKTLLNAEMNGGSITFPASLWIRLYTEVLDDTVSGDEVSAPSYAAVEFVCNTTNFPTTLTAEIANAVEKSVAVAEESWGELTGWAAWDAETAGNPHWWGNFPASITIDTGAVVVIPAGNLIFAEDNTEDE